MLWEKRKERRGIAPLIGALIPLVTGILSAGGSAYTANKNKQSVKDQMAFQERMSSTAAQRSKADYEAAGLNPALAYERTASSPGGASATIEDALSKGISSAQAATRLRQEMKLAQQQTESTVALNRGQEEQARSQAHLNVAQERATTTALGWNAIQQPYMLRTAAANALAQEALAQQEALRIPGMQNTANWERTLQKAGPMIGTARTLSELIKNLGGVLRK